MRIELDKDRVIERVEEKPKKKGGAGYRKLYLELKESPGQMKLIEAAILNGYTEDEIRNWYNMTAGSWEWNKGKWKEFRLLVENARSKVVSESTRNLKMLADGFKMKTKRLDRGGKLVEVEEYYPPDRNANVKILVAHNPQVWDDGLKRKRVPEVKIVVGLEGKELDAVKRSIKRKSIEADYVVEAV